VDVLSLGVSRSWRFIASVSLMLVVGCQVYDGEVIKSGSSQTLEADGGDAGSSDAGPAETRCGDGRISGVEKCDVAIDPGMPGACPSECSELSACQQRALNGTACQRECVVLPAQCRDGDGCCPGNCSAENDKDCSAGCGDHVVDRERGETCESDSRRPCPTECDDNDPCTRDDLLGSAANCNARCVHTPLDAVRNGDSCCQDGSNANVDSDCQPRCGNGVREGDEVCDGDKNCAPTCDSYLTDEQAACMRAHASDACERCSCMRCTTPYMQCSAGGRAADNALCGELIACAAKSGCLGLTCYCGESELCAGEGGPCLGQVEAAGRSTDPVALLLSAADPFSPLGAASATHACRETECLEACQPNPD
jgi:hypothetical protein